MEELDLYTKISLSPTRMFVTSPCSLSMEACADEPAGFYFMDFETGEVINITEEAEKYNLLFYKGYYNAFIGREYVEEERDFIWGMWSKDKIIGEAKARQQIEGNEG